MLKHLFVMLTGLDGATLDVGRAAFVVIVLVYLFLAGWTVMWQGHPFDYASFGGGLAAIATGIGALLWMKKDTEPGAPSVGKVTKVSMSETSVEGPQIPRP